MLGKNFIWESKILILYGIWGSVRGYDHYRKTNVGTVNCHLIIQSYWSCFVCKLKICYPRSHVLLVNVGSITDLGKNTIPSDHVLLHLCAHQLPHYFVLCAILMWNIFKEYIHDALSFPTPYNLNLYSGTYIYSDVVWCQVYRIGSPPFPINILKFY